MRIKIISRLALFALSPAVAADNAALHWICPDTVAVESGSLTKNSIPAGSDVMFSKTPAHLTGISVFDGPPVEEASLVPTTDNASRSKNAPAKQDIVSKWIFEGDNPRGYFVSCDYADGLIRLSQKVNGAARACTATTQYVKPYGNFKASFSCE